MSSYPDLDADARFHMRGNQHDMGQQAELHDADWYDAFLERQNQAGLNHQTELHDADWYDAFLERQNQDNVPRSGLDRLAQCIRFHLAAAFGYSSLPQSAGLKSSHNLRHSHPRWANVGALKNCKLRFQERIESVSFMTWKHGT